MPKRAGDGQENYEKYASAEVKPASGGMTNAECLFLVRVTINDLNIQKNAGLIALGHAARVSYGLRTARGCLQ